MQLHLARFHQLIRFTPVALAALLAVQSFEAAAQPVTTQLPVLKTGGALLNATVTTPAAATMNINQTASNSNRALVEWTSFSIGSAAKVNIVQPNAQSVLVNRVVGAGVTAPIAASEIYGTMSANGRIFLVNPTGIVFGPGAQVNVGSLVATTLDLASASTTNNYQSLMAGDPIQLAASLRDSSVSLSVLAATDPTVPQIQAGTGGSIMLLSRDKISQAGTISAPGGQINMTSALAATLVPVGTSGFVELSLSDPTKLQTGVTTASTSSTTAAGGSIIIGAQDKDDATRSDILDISGTVSADSSTGKGGSVRIDAGTNGDLTVNSATTVSASSTAATGIGGTVSLQGNNIFINGGSPILSALIRNSHVLAEGSAGGGTINIGSSTTRAVTIAANSNISADATASGNGGSITAQATYNDNNPQPLARLNFGVTEIYGALTARGGPNGGNGGAIETSGAALTTSLLDPATGITKSGTMDASARASSGKAGSWTLDPFDVTISSTATTAVNGAFNPTGPGANVNAADISAALNSGTSVDISTAAGGSGTAAGNITFANATSIQRSTGTAATSLTLEANNNIAMTGSSIATSAGPVNVSFIADSDGSGAGGINITGAIATGGGTLTLVGGSDPTTGYATSTTGGVTLGAGTIDTRGTTGAGAVTIRGRAAAGSASPGVNLGSTFTVGDMNVRGLSSSGSAVSMNGANITTASGLIDIRGVTTRVDTTTNTLVGVNVGVSDIQLGTGSLTIAGRGDDANLATTFGSASGLRFNDLRISAAANSTGTITLAGQATGASQGNGIGAVAGGNSGLVISSNASTPGSAATGASVVIGASSSGTQALSLSAGAGPSINTTGAVNLRPLGVDATGQITESTATPIVVAAPAAASGAAGSFVVNAATLRPTTAQVSGITAGEGIVIGSAGQSGAITVQANALTQHDGLSLSLQNEGTGSQGIAIGAGNRVGSLGLLTTGNVTQSGPLTVLQELVVRGGPQSSVTLNNTGNQFGLVAFRGPASFSLVQQGVLTVDAADVLGYDVNIGAAVGSAPGNGRSVVTALPPAKGFNSTSISTSLAGNSVLLQSTNNNVVINEAILLTGTGSPRLDIVSPTQVTFGTEVSLDAGGGGWRLWTPTTVNAPDRPNLYGCAFGDTTACSISGAAIPLTGNLLLVPTQPTITVVPDTASAPVNSALPALTYTATGFLNGDTAATALAGTLGTTATNGSPAGTYVINAGTLSSPTGYLLAVQPGSVLTLNAPNSLDALGVTRQMLQSRFTSEMSSDVYGRNLSQPFVCTAASIVRGSVADGSIADPLSSEWGKVRNQPQLSGCLNVADGGQCSAF